MNWNLRAGSATPSKSLGRDAHVVQIGSALPIHIEGVGGEHERAVSTAIGRATFVSLGAPCLVLRHHRSVFVHGVGGAVGCILGGARKAISQKFEEAVWSRESPHLKEVGAKCAQEQEPVRGCGARENDVGGHDLRESSGIRHITAISNGSSQRRRLDHECGTGKIGEQGVAVPLDI